MIGLRFFFCIFLQHNSVFILLPMIIVIYIILHFQVQEQHQLDQFDQLFTILKAIDEEERQGRNFKKQKFFNPKVISFKEKNKI